MVLVEFVYEKIHAYLLLDKLYRNYIKFIETLPALKERLFAKYLPLAKKACF